MKWRKSSATRIAMPEINKRLMGSDTKVAPGILGAAFLLLPEFAAELAFAPSVGLADKSIISSSSTKRRRNVARLLAQGEELTEIDLPRPVDVGANATALLARSTKKMASFKAKRTFIALKQKNLLRI
jgi:hypothetical protein